MSNLKEAAQQALLAWNTVCGAQGWDPMHLEQFVRLREVLAQLDDKAQPVARDGWMLVPVKPTLEMTAAYLEAQGAAAMGTDRAFGVSDPKQNFAIGYSAMLAAAPQPPAELDPHPPSRHCMCKDCAPSFEGDLPAEQGCNCRWNGGEVLQRCELHQAWFDTIHEWAERAKDAERRLRELSSQKPAEQGAELSDEQIDTIWNATHWIGTVEFQRGFARAIIAADRAERGGV